MHNLSRAISEASHGYPPNRYTVSGFFFLSLTSSFCLPLNLIQEGSHAGHCVRRGGTQKVPVVCSKPNALSSGEFHTHSVCRYVVVGTLQPRRQPFKHHRLAGWLAGWGGLVGGGISGGLTLNWQPREYRALSLPRSPTPMLSFPFFTLDH